MQFLRRGLPAVPAVSLGLGIGLYGSVLPSAAQAAFTVISQPDSAYTGSTNVFSLDGIADFDPVSTLALGTQALTFNKTLEKRTVLNNWATWGSPPDTESATPKIVFDESSSPLEMLLAETATSFGFEVESSDFGVYNFEAEFYKDSLLVGSINRSVDGNAGARLLAASYAEGFTRVVLLSDPDAGGFALGQLRFGSAPNSNVPAPLPLLGAAAAFRCSRRIRKRMQLKTASSNL